MEQNNRHRACHATNYRLVSPDTPLAVSGYKIKMHVFINSHLFILIMQFTWEKQASSHRHARVAARCAKSQIIAVTRCIGDFFHDRSNLFSHTSPRRNVRKMRTRLRIAVASFQARILPRDGKDVRKLTVHLYYESLTASTRNLAETRERSGVRLERIKRHEGFYCLLQQPRARMIMSMRTFNWN